MSNAIVGSLDLVLQVLADYLNLDYRALALRADEDQHTGWDFGAGDWPCGSLHRAEGQILYALVSILGGPPVEIGSFCGCSTTHMAEALRGLNIVGNVQAVDIYGFNFSRVPSHLLMWIEQHTMDGADYLRGLPDNSQGLIYEDGSHSFVDVRDIWLLAKDKLKSGGVILSHDADHPTARDAILSGIEAAGITDYLIVRPEPSDCGFALWQKKE